MNASVPGHAVTLGLISDTHMGDRLQRLPESLAEAFAGVELILHAGDVGELWVLDALSQIAPVIAVHGNDELAGAPQVLPAQQMIHAGGQRILLHHGNRANHADEQAARRIDAWGPKLDHWAGMARAVGASMLVYGHTHIGWAIEHDGIWLVNPGGIASGSHFERQLIPSAARMVLTPGQPPQITYINLNGDPGPMPRVDPAAGFRAAYAQRAASILSEELLAERDWFLREVYPLAPETLITVARGFIFACLDGQRTHITRPELVSALLAHPDLPPAVQAMLRARWPQDSTGE